MSVDPNDVIRYLRTRGRDRILERFAPSSCIASTRIGIEVLKAFGVKAYPIPVRLEVLNAAARLVMAQGVEDVDVARALRGKVLGVEGKGVLDPVAHDWDGHLVIGLRDAAGIEVVVDLSFDQFARPAYDLTLHPFAVSVDEWPFLVTDDVEGWVAVFWKIETRSFRQSRDWTHRDRWEDLVATMVSDIRSTHVDPVTPPA